MENRNDSIEVEACSAPICSAVPSHARLQDDLDWSVFAAKFKERNGFAPHPQDTGHKEAFHWFAVGAHAEFMGRLNVQPNYQEVAGEALPPSIGSTQRITP